MMSKVEPMTDTPEIPEGMNPHAAETWPSAELIESFLGDSRYDLHLGPGNDVTVSATTRRPLAAARRFRDVLSQFGSGVTVVTTMSGDEPVGMTCQSFSSVSLDPPLVMFVPAKTSRAWPMIQRAGRFCVNVLGGDQADAVEPDGQPGCRQVRRGRLGGVAAHGLARAGRHPRPHRLHVHAVHEAGDHYVVIGRALDLQVGDEPGDPLLFFRGQYRTTATD